MNAPLKIKKAQAILSKAAEEALAVITGDDTVVAKVDKRRGRMSPNRMLNNTDLCEAIATKLALYDIHKVGELRNFMRDKTPKELRMYKLTPRNVQAIREFLGE